MACFRWDGFGKPWVPWEITRVSKCPKETVCMSYVLLPERTLRLLSLRGKRFCPRVNNKNSKENGIQICVCHFFCVTLQPEVAKITKYGI